MGQDTVNKGFCPNCGEILETYILERAGGSFGEVLEETCCIHCSMPVQDQCKQEIRPVESILIADDLP